MGVRWLWGCLVVSGCSETGLSSIVEPDEVPLVDNTVDTALEVCGPRDFPAGSAGGADEDCVNEVSTEAFSPVVEWRMEDFDEATTYRSVMMQPVVASLSDDDGDGDIDGDDIPDILFIRYPDWYWTLAGVLTAVQGDGSEVLWSNDSHDLQGSGGLAVGDIDGDGIVEILAVTTRQELVALEHDGTLKWKTDYLGFACATTAPAISDMDGDGSPEIVVGFNVYDSDGMLLGRGDAGWGNCLSFPADLDGDGEQEVVTGNAVYRIDGTEVWNNGLLDGYPAVADFDGDGDPEIVVVDLDGTVRLTDHTGVTLWGYTRGGKGPPTIADFDGDGLPEIGVASSSTYAVFDGDGTRLWRQGTVDVSSGITGASVFDFEGDGVAEVVHADETRTWVFAGNDGAVKLEDDNHTSWTWTEYPVVADVDGDGEAEIVVPSSLNYDEPDDPVYGITVLGGGESTWQPGRKIWNQHAYHITNVEDDGSIPAVAQPSWSGPNSFRSGDISGKAGTRAPDLVVEPVELCALECASDRLVLWVQAGNIGAVDARGATLYIYGETDGERTLLVTEALADLTAGELTEGVEVVLDGVDADGLDALIFSVETDELECDLSNNEAVWYGPFCPE